jgi:hypothetical protein
MFGPRHVDERHRGGERRHTPRAFRVERPRGLFDDLEPTDARRDEHAHLIGISSDIQTRVEDRLACRCHREENVRRTPASFLAPENRRRVKPLHLAGDLHREQTRVEVRNPRDAAAAGADRVPTLRRAVADWRHGTDAGDDDASLLSLRHGVIS